jgi:hypothetical protein
MNEYLCWPYLRLVFKLERRFITLATGELETEIHYGPTCLTHKRASPQRLLAIIRSEWGIENGLHFRRDVTFQEDQTRMTDKQMGRAMAINNNLVIILLDNQGYMNHAQACREFDASPAKSLTLICGL